MIKVKWDASEWVDVGVELRRWKNMDVPTFVRHRARVFTQDVIRFTPPRGKNPGSESFPSMKKRGEKSVESDIRRVFQALDKSQLVNKDENPRIAKYLRRYIAAGNLSAIKKLLDRIGVRYNSLYAIPFPSIHERCRNARGQVRKRYRNIVLRDSDIKKYIKQRQAMVGEYKAHWNKAATATGVKPRNWPSWVSRHGERGKVEDRLKNVSRPTLTIINDAKMVGEGDQQRFVDAALIINNKKMQIELNKIKGWNDFKRGRGISRPI